MLCFIVHGLNFEKQFIMPTFSTLKTSLASQFLMYHVLERYLGMNTLNMKQQDMGQFINHLKNEALNNAELARRSHSRSFTL